MDVLKPLMAAPSPSVPLRRAYGVAMIYLGFSQLRSNQEEAAVKTLEAAREAYRSIDGLQARRPAVGGRLRRGDGWQMEALQTLGRIDEASAGRRGGAAGSRTGARKAARPHAGAARPGADRRLAWPRRRFRPAPAQGPGTGRARRARLGGRLKLDPSNQIALEQPDRLTRDNAGGACVEPGTSAGARRVTGARDLAVEPRVKESGHDRHVLSLSRLSGRRLEADLGQSARQTWRSRFAASASSSWQYARCRRIRSAACFLPEFLGFYGFPADRPGLRRVRAARRGGDYETVRGARASAQRIEQMKDVRPHRRAADKSRWKSYRTAAEASYRLKDYAAADADIKHGPSRSQAHPEAHPCANGATRPTAHARRMLAARQERMPRRSASSSRCSSSIAALCAEDNDDLCAAHASSRRRSTSSALPHPARRRPQLTRPPPSSTACRARCGRLISRRAVWRDDRRGTEARRCAHHAKRARRSAAISRRARRGTRATRSVQRSRALTRTPSCSIAARSPTRAPARSTKRTRCSTARRPRRLGHRRCWPIS